MPTDHVGSIRVRSSGVFPLSSVRLGPCNPGVLQASAILSHGRYRRSRQTAGSRSVSDKDGVRRASFDHMKSRIFGNRLVSMPFLDLGGPITDDQEVRTRPVGGRFGTGAREKSELRGTSNVQPFIRGFVRSTFRKRNADAGRPPPQRQGTDAVGPSRHFR